MPDLEVLERGLKGSSHGASWRPAHILLLFLSTPAACFSLHLLTPGGLVHSHLLVVDSLSLLLCFMYLLLFVLARPPTDGTTQQKVQRLCVGDQPPASCPVCMSSQYICMLPLPLGTITLYQAIPYAQSTEVASKASI